MPPELWFATAALMILTAISFWSGAHHLTMAVVLVDVFITGLLLHTLRQPGPPPTLDAQARETVTLTGCVVDPPVFYEGRDQFVLELAPGARARASIYLRDGEQPPALAYGQRVELDAQVRRPRNFHNPGAFDYVRFLARDSIYWTASARSAANLRILPGACGSRFWSAIFTLRVAGLVRIEKLYPGNPYAIGMMQAILLGDSSKLEKIWTVSFRRTGTYHALVISGLHVAVLAGVLLFLLRIAFVPQMPALLLTALAAWLYALVSGWSAPVVRSAGGFTLFLVARYFNRRGRILNLLAAVGFAILVCDPEQMFDASFQLSFLAVAAIGALAAPVLERTTAPLIAGLKRLRDTGLDMHLPARTAQFRIELRLALETLYFWVRIPVGWSAVPLALTLRFCFWIWESALISAMVQVGLALPMAVYFHRVSLSGLTANLAIVPLLSAVVPLGFLAIFTNWHWPAAIAEIFLRWSQRIAEAHAAWEPNWRVPDPPLWLAIGFVAALLLLATLANASRVWRWSATAAVLSLFTILLWHPFPPKLEAGSLEFTLIDVGQGESLFLSFPNGKTMLVDGGGIPGLGRRKPRMDIGEDVVAPYLWTRSLRRIDIVAASHLHADHAGGLPALIEAFRPKELWVSAHEQSEVWTQIEAQARAAGTRIIEMRVGGGAQFGPVQLDVLSPAADFVPGHDPHNNDSLVMRIVFGRHSFLLMGDADWKVETAIPLARTDVLKVGHHGSRTSSSDDFLDALRPPFAAISAGTDNSYGNPHWDVLERLALRGVALFRTDEDGLVTIRTDGHKFSSETWRQLHREETALRNPQ